MATVFFHYAEKGVRIPKIDTLKKFITGIFRSQKIGLARVDYIFCSDKYLLLLNRKFLLKDNYTDIITFCLNEAGEQIVGEVYISIERVKDNAIRYKVLIREEILRIIFHGTLHLCGFTDKKASEKKKMTAWEDFYLQKFLKVSRRTVS